MHSSKVMISNTKPLKALVVEDNATAQSLHRILLENLGYQVEITDNGYTALEWISKSDYHCVLLDIGLPDISGEFVLSAVRYRERKTGKHLLIIVNSSHIGEDLLERCLKIGANAVLSKPVQPEKLREILSTL